MSDVCRVLDWSRANFEGAPLDRVEPDTVDYFEGDGTADIDCNGVGVTIVSAVPTVRAEDDDGNLTFGTVTLTGLTWRVPYTVSANAVQSIYSILVTVTTSDARTLRYWYRLPVVPTQHAHA